MRTPTIHGPTLRVPALAVRVGWDQGAETRRRSAVVGEITLEQDIDEILGSSSDAGAEAPHDQDATASTEPEDEEGTSDGPGDDEDDED